MSNNIENTKNFSDIFKEFTDNINEIKHLEEVYEYLENQNVKLYNDNILRAELVLAISAFDHYLHEIINYGLVEIYQNKKPITPKSESFEFSLKTVQIWLDPSINQDIKIEKLRTEINKKHNYKSFQNSKNINDSITLILDTKDFWSDVAKYLNPQKNVSVKNYNELIKDQTKSIKEKLNLTVKRRNDIAHSFDRVFGIINPIFQEDVEESIIFLESIAKAIDYLIK